MLQRIFPGSRIIICNFHALKWMKSLFATALIPTEQKHDIMEGFRGLLYAPNKILYEEQLINWTKVASGVEVKPRAGPKGTWVLLEDYFNKNWLNCIEMWTMHERNNLPVGKEHTNNRLERAWRTMKLMLVTLNVGQVSIATAVRNLVYWAEMQLRTRYTDSRRKVMHISDPDPALMQLYSEAAKELTKPGMMLFKEKIMYMHKFEASMSVLDDGQVEQVFKTETETSLSQTTVYQTTETSCNCVTRRRNPSCPCYHTLFLRRSRCLPLFVKELFGERYHRDERIRDLDDAEDVKNPPSEDKIEDEEAVPDNPEAELENEVDYSNLQQKFQIANAKFGWLLGAFCGLGKPEFRRYMGELEILAQRVRMGQSLLSGSLEDKPRTQPGSRGESEVIQERGADADEAPATKLKFHAKLSARGRPAGTGAGPTNFYIPGVKARKQRGKTSARSGSQAAANKRTLSEPRRKKQKMDLHSEVDSEQLQVVTVPSDEELQATRDLVLCRYIPGVDGALPFTLKDYRMLQPGIWGSDAHIDFYLKYVEHTVNNYRMIVVQSLLYTQLDKNRELENWLRSVPFWQEGGPELVLLPVCRHQHWVLLVAQLHPVQPYMFLLDSLGNSQEDAREARLFSDFLLSRRPAELSYSDFIVIVPRVPQQPNYNDCAFFAAKNAEMVLRQPDGFIAAARLPTALERWYEVVEVRGARRDLAELVRRLAGEQRERGGLLEGEDFETPEIDFMQVRFRIQAPPPHPAPNCPTPEGCILFTDPPPPPPL